MAWPHSVSGFAPLHSEQHSVWRTQARLMCSVPLQPEQTVAAVRVRAESQQFRGNIKGLLSSLFLYTVDFWLWRLVFDFCREGLPTRISEAGRKWGEWSETWPGQGPFVGDLNLSSLFALPAPECPFSCGTDKRGELCFSLGGGNAKTFTQRPRSGASKSGSNLLIYLSYYH